MVVAGGILGALAKGLEVGKLETLAPDASEFTIFSVSTFD